MKKLITILLLFSQFSFAQLSTKIIPLRVFIPQGTQAQEDSSLSANRIWELTAFSTVPESPPSGLPIATATARGTVPATGTPSGKYLKDDMTWAAIAGGFCVVFIINISEIVKFKNNNNN